MIIQQQPELNVANARRVHHEIYGPALVNAWWLRIFCGGLVTSVLVLGLGFLKVEKQLKREKILVVSPAQDGSFDGIRYVQMSDYKPTDKQLMYFFRLWTMRFYGRVRASIANDYPESLELFSPNIARTLNLQERQSQWIQEFLNAAAMPEIRIVVRKVRMDNNSSATIDFEKHFYIGEREDADHMESWTAQLQYELVPDKNIPASMIATNPIGIKITALPVETKGF